LKLETRDLELAAATSGGGVVRQVWVLAWPAILAFGLESLVGLVDTLMVGRLGAEPLAGVGVGAQILHAVHVVVIAVGGGTIALVARFVGGGQRGEAERVLAQSLYTAVVFGVVVATPMYFLAAPAVAAFGVEPTVVSEGAGYLRYLMLGLPFAASFQIFAAAFRGAGDMRTPLLLGAIVNIVNIFGNYVLIFGALGVPAMGARGSGLASTLAFGVGVVLAVAVMRRRDAVLRLRAASLRIDLALARRILRIGFPAAIEQCFLQAGFFFYLAVASNYGTDAMAAYFIGVRILALSFLPGMGFAAAASTIVGQSLGAGRADEAARGGWDACRLAVGLMSFAGVAIFLAAEWIAFAFVDDAEVIAAAVPFIRTLAVAQPLMALDFTLSGALRGAGDTRFPLLVLILGFYGARLGAAWAAAYVFDLGLTWVWLALLGDYAVRSLLKVHRFRGDRWQGVAV
jgi:putative MATE family efflux protein